MVEYDRIKNETPLAYYPLHVGDVWQYNVKEKQSSEDETTKLITIKVRGKEVVDGKEYFTLTNSETYCIQYLRIDSSDATVWELKDGSDCMIDSLTMLPNSKGFTNQCFGSSACISDTTKVLFGEERSIRKFYYTDGTTCTFGTRGHYEYAENIGKTFTHMIYPAPEGFEGGYKIDSLVFAKIDGVEYGEYVSENINPDIAFYPLHVGDTWQYHVNFDTVPVDDDTTYYSTTKVIGTDTLNEKKYFIIDDSDGPTRYIRIDTTDATVWEYLDESDCIVDSVSMGIDQYGFENKCASIICMEDTVSTIFEDERRIKTFMTSYIVSTGSTVRYQYAFGVGQVFHENTYSHVWADVTSKTLVYAQIEGVKYGTFVSIDDKPKVFPLRFHLSQNYPNPFNPSTLIRYEIGDIRRETQHVSLRVYDILGRVVATLVNKNQSAGNYEIIFDTSTGSESANGLTSGIYFYQLQSGRFVESKKMILLR